MIMLLIRILEADAAFQDQVTKSEEKAKHNRQTGSRRPASGESAPEDEDRHRKNWRDPLKNEQ
jgi:hypothetical protein